MLLRFEMYDEKCIFSFCHIYIRIKIFIQLSFPLRGHDRKVQHVCFILNT